MTALDLFFENTFCKNIVNKRNWQHCERFERLGTEVEPDEHRCELPKQELAFLGSVVTLFFIFLGSVVGNTFQNRIRLNSLNEIFSVRFEATYLHEFNTEKFGFQSELVFDSIAQKIQRKIFTCRQYYTAESLPVALEIKWNYVSQTIKVVSLQNRGNATIAACIRDKISGEAFEEIQNLKKIKNQYYNLFLIAESGRINSR